MKSNTYLQYILWISLVAGVAACGSSDEKSKNEKEVKTKKEELTKLRNEQVAMLKKISDLEKEIKTLSPDSTAAKTKDVAVTELKPQKFDNYVQTQGLIEAEDNILVSSKGMGVVTQVFVKEGQNVVKGQVLAQMDNSLVLRNIEGMKSQLELATSIYERQKNLWDQKIGTEVQYMQSKTNKESLEKQIAGLYEQNEMTRIKSPIEGVVDYVSVKVGENISPGQPAVRVINSSDLKVTAKISESYITNIKKGNKISVTIPDIKEELNATVTFIARNIDPLSRTFVLEADLPSNHELRPNMTALIKVIYQSFPAALTVPINAVQDINGEKVIYIAEKTGNQTVARRKVVTVDGVFDGRAQVQGLQAGDNVITAGYQGLNDGQFIKIQ